MTVPQPRQKTTVTERIVAWQTAFFAVLDELVAAEMLDKLPEASGIKDLDELKAMRGRIATKKVEANITMRPVAAQIAAELVKGVNA